VAAYAHIPVLLEEVLQALRPRDGGRYVDGTVGGGGHAAAILQASSPGGWLFGCDRDGAAIEAAPQRLAPYGGRCQLRRGNFAELADWIEAGSCDGVLLDLGVSSPQLDEAGRGFSVRLSGPLDMRQDQRQSVTAALLVNTAPVEELAKMFWEYGGERDSRRIARAIERERHRRPFETTDQLAGLVERLVPRRGSRTHPATQVFQALRIAVNDELGALAAWLDGLPSLLGAGGRAAAISFHSLEDRMVKERFRALTRACTCPPDLPICACGAHAGFAAVTRRAIQASQEEVARNPRSRSARLRAVEKLR